MSSRETVGAEQGLFPRARFETDFLRRLEAFLPRLASAREKREGAGRSSLALGGEEFVGFRPYSPGEDLRQLDWNLLARLDRPFIRTTRREASESWSLLLDGSASMAVGPPGKFQRAAEVALALASLGLRRGARIVVRVSGTPEGSAEFVAHRPSALGQLAEFLEGQRAEGTDSFETLLASGLATRGMGRVFCISDFQGVEISKFLAHSRRGCLASAIQLLAPQELKPARSGFVEWLDPETSERLRLELDARTASAYEHQLRAWLETWRATCAQHRASYGLWSSEVSFEELLTELLAR